MERSCSTEWNATSALRQLDFPHGSGHVDAPVAKIGGMAAAICGGIF